MFNRATQVQHVDVNEWVGRLISARDDTSAVERIRKRLDDMNRDAIVIRAEALEKEKLYDFYYQGVMPVDGDFERFVMDLIDYQMPEELIDRWQAVLEKFQSIKAERAKANAGSGD